jgi:hypothetical protein
MGRMSLGYPRLRPAGRSVVVADVLVRQYPSEEEDEGECSEDDDDADGYSE